MGGWWCHYRPIYRISPILSFNLNWKYWIFQKSVIVDLKICFYFFKVGSTMIIRHISIYFNKITWHCSLTFHMFFWWYCIWVPLCIWFNKFVSIMYNFIWSKSLSWSFGGKSSTIFATVDATWKICCWNSIKRFNFKLCLLHIH